MIEENFDTHIVVTGTVVGKGFNSVVHHLACRKALLIMLITIVSMDTVVKLLSIVHFPLSLQHVQRELISL